MKTHQIIQFTATLIILCVAALMASAFPSPLLKFKHNPRMVSALPWGSFCVTSTTVACMDFDGFNCTDSGGLACFTAAVIDPNCTTGLCPIEGTESLRSVSAFARAFIKPTFWPGIVPGQQIRCGFDFVWESAGTETAPEDIAQMYSAGVARDFGIAVDYDEAGDQLVCLRTDASTITCAAGDAFNIGDQIGFCIEYEYNSTDIRMWNNRDCSGTPLLTGVATGSWRINGIKFVGASLGAVTIWDDLKCELTIL